MFVNETVIIFLIFRSLAVYIISGTGKDMISRTIKIFTVIPLLVFLLVSCSSATPAAEPQSVETILPDEPTTVPQAGMPRSEAEVPRVTVEETIAAVQNGEAIIVDVRSPQAYQASHIPGALTVPLGEIETNPTGLNLDQDQWIITYCT
jgi:hypothetical protein